MLNLRSADSPNVDCTGFDQEFFADYCMFFWRPAWTRSVSWKGLVQSDSHKAPLRIAFPTLVLSFYFPDFFTRLYLEDQEEKKISGAV